MAPEVAFRAFLWEVVPSCDRDGHRGQTRYTGLVMYGLPCRRIVRSTAMSVISTPAKCFGLVFVWVASRRRLNGSSDNFEPGANWMGEQSAYIFDLDRIMREASQLTLSHSRTTHAIVSFPNLKLFVIYMPAESVWSEHSTPGRIAVQVLRGHIVMTANGKRYELSAGCGAAFDSDVKHDVHALSEAWFLLTVAHRTEK